MCGSLGTGNVPPPMTRPTLAGLALGLSTILVLPTALAAQWSSNPSQNLSIGDGPGEQVLPKIAATSDGGCYLGWFDSRSGGYAVYLQRLSADGTEQWPHGGLLVSNNPQSTSLVDWDLICDSDDHCVLAFTDTRAGGDLDIYAYRIDAAGTFVWGNNGIALSNNSDYEPNPRICEASDGDFVFAWANTGLRTIQLQRLDRGGTPRFPGDGIATQGDPSSTPAFCEIVAADNGSCVISWVRTLSFSGNKHIHVQKFDAAGTALWNGGTRFAAFDQASVPIAHQPRLRADGAGGAVLAWHFAVGQAFSCRVQHLLANGSEAFAHNGIDVSTSAGSKFDPAIVYRAATQETFVAWNERNLAQSQWGLFAQKIDAAGSLAWGNSGVTLLPINTVVKFAPVAAALGDGFAVSVLEESLGLNQKKVLLFGLDATGSPRWTPATDACTFASDKLRLQIATTASGVSLLAWTDHRAGTPDAIAQSVEIDGVPGIHLGTAVPYGCSGNPAGSLTSQGRPAVGTTMMLGITNPVGTQAVGSLPVLALALLPDAAYPCGSSQPGFGMSGPNVPGELLIAPGSAATLFGSPWAGPGQPTMFPFSLPLGAWLLGVNVYAQGLLFDPSPSAAVPIGLSSALHLTIGS